MRFILVFIIFINAFQSDAQGNLEIDTCTYPFYHGVASGDPMEDRVIIWTRVTPDSISGGQVLVSYKVSEDTSFTSIVSSGSVLTDQTKDYTVKVDLENLESETFYYYEFEALGRRSVIGRTRTAPNENSSRTNVRFAIVSCANLEAGYFNTYKVINERNDVDAVMCLGDYIYEYESGGYSPNSSTQRFFEPSTEIVTLADYRMRYSTYHLDRDLKRNHQLYPWICVWDDHESANDSWLDGAENHTEGTEGVWNERKECSKQAYFEWLPIRETSVTDPYQIYRSINYGPLCDLVMLDTRLNGRDEQDGTTGSTVDSEFRELLGQDQRQWMNDELLNSEAQWKILVQQVMIAPLEVAGVGVNGDQWDGYPAERDKLYDFLETNSIDNLVVVTGDIHTSWANDLPGDSYSSGSGAGSMGVEFVTPSVTSPGFPIGFGTSVIQAANPHMKFIDLTQHGFIVLDVGEDKVQGDWFYVNTIDTESNQYSHGASWFCVDESNHLTSSASVTIPPADLVASIQGDLCPRIGEDPIDDVSFEEEKLTVLSLYPNPAQDFVMIQFYAHESNDFMISLYDLSGRMVYQQASSKIEGLYIERYPLPELAQGQYILNLSLGDYNYKQSLFIGQK